jgi:hypothetical protein
MQGIKHYIECHCITPQFKNKKKPIYFGFSVFSVLSDEDEVENKFVQCPNCGVIHKVVDLCKSEILSGKDESVAVRTLDDIKFSIPENLVQLLESNRTSYADYEKLEWILNNEIWDETVILTSDIEEGTRVGKILKFSKDGRPRVEPFASVELIN